MKKIFHLLIIVNCLPPTLAYPPILAYYPQIWLAPPTLACQPHSQRLPKRLWVTPPIYNFIISFQIATDAGVNLARIKSLNYPDPFLDLIFDSIIRKSLHQSFDFQCLKFAYKLQRVVSNNYLNMSVVLRSIQEDIILPLKHLLDFEQISQNY